MSLHETCSVEDFMDRLKSGKEVLGMFKLHGIHASPLFCCNYIKLLVDYKNINMQDGRKKGCNFHLWFDPPMCPRSKTIIPGLLRKVEKLEDVVAAKKKKERLLLMVVVLMFVICFFLM